MQLVFILSLTLILFAANSVLCRLALADNSIDAASFTSVRLLSGALSLIVVWLIQQKFTQKIKPDAVNSPPVRKTNGHWLAAFALFCYAACFSFGYIQIDTGTGALILFASVQFTIIGYSYWKGTRYGLREYAGMLCAFAGFLVLVAPTLQTPAITSFILMMLSGIAWGSYTLLGRSSKNAIADSMGNFIRSIPMAIGLCLLVAIVAWPIFPFTQYMHAELSAIFSVNISIKGLILAISSGAIASGLGYALWYHALTRISALLASLLQLSVPILSAIGGVVFAAEQPSLALFLASALVLGGLTLIIVKPQVK